MGQIVFLNDKGHTAIKWDEAKPETVEKARDQVNALLGGGYLIFDASAPGHAKQIDAFDPTIKEIGVVKQFVGG